MIRLRDGRCAEVPWWDAGKTDDWNYEPPKPKRKIWVCPELPQPGQGDRFEALVQDWRPQGFGFALLKDGRRVYIHASAMGGGDLRPGEVINGTLIQDPKNAGKWQAHDVEVGHIGQAGTLVEWNENDRFGFLTMDDGKRAFIHHSVFGEGDLLIGSRFRVLLSPDVQDPNKLCVLEIREQLSSVGHEGATSSGPGFKPGVVQQWNQERGFGFIELDDGRRLHVHHTAFGGGSMREGGRVEAIPMADKKNPHKWTAAVVRGDGVVTAGPRRTEPQKSRDEISAAAARAMASLAPASLQAAATPSVHTVDVAHALSGANIQALSAASAGILAGGQLDAQTLLALATAQNDPSQTSQLLASLHALHAAAGSQAQAQAEAQATGYGLFGSVAAHAAAEQAVMAPQYMQYSQMNIDQAAASEDYAARLMREAKSRRTG